MSVNFVNISRSVKANSSKKPGHSDRVLWTAHANITSFAPTVSDGTPGSKKTITGNHTIAGGVNYIQAKAKSVKAAGDATGEAGGQVRTFKYNLTIDADGPIIEETVSDMINEDTVFWFNDPECDVERLIQVGGKCNPATISNYQFLNEGRGAGGRPQHSFDVECTDRVWYEGTLVEKEDAELAAPTILTFSLVEDTTMSATWPAVTNAVNYTVEIDTDPAFGTSVSSTVAAPTVTKAFTTLTADTVYYVRVRATATGYTSSPWVTGAVKTDAA